MAAKNNTTAMASIALNELKAEELKLFHAYNRHHDSIVKLQILNKLIAVIHKQDALKSILHD